jgi:predicted AlkP superfamily pyrophosphatase or phosphodiesterase
VGVLASFFQVLHSATVNRDRADRLWWVPFKKGVFKVKTYFNSLAGSEGRRFPWTSVWRTQAPSRAAFFFLVGSPRQDTYGGKSQEEEYHHCG